MGIELANNTRQVFPEHPGLHGMWIIHTNAAAQDTEANRYKHSVPVCICCVEYWHQQCKFCAAEQLDDIDGYSTWWMNEPGGGGMREIRLELFVVTRRSTLAFNRNNNDANLLKTNVQLLIDGNKLSGRVI